MIKSAILAGVLMGALLATEVLAAESACLTRNRLVSSRAVGGDTIEMTDRQMNRFIVRTQACPNLDFTNATVIVGRSWNNLSCLNSSVTLNVSAPGRGVRACRVVSVEAANPAPPAG